MVLIATCHIMGDAVRQARLGKGWTQAELAERAGVSRQWLSQMERGKCSVELHKVLAAIGALGLCVSLVPERPSVYEDAIRAAIGISTRV